MQNYQYIRLDSISMHVLICYTSLWCLGLTIERKTPGQRHSNKDRFSSSPMVDKVEITKIPVGGGASSTSNGTSSPLRSDLFSSSSSASHSKNAGNALDLSTSRGGGESPLNLSVKVKTSAASVTRNRDANSLYNSKQEEEPASKIPSEYYACE